MAIFDAHAYLEGFPLPGINQNAAQIMQHMKARGIDGALLLSVRAAVADPLSGNRILKAMLDQEPTLLGCLTASIHRVDASLQAIRDLAGNRKFVAFRLTSIFPGEPMKPLIVDEILNACRRYQKPILIHTLDATCIEAALHLAKTYSMHKFVFLGMGGADWRTGIIAAQQSTNIYLETSGTLDRAKIPAAIEAIGAHRVLFGSGAPEVDPVAVLGLIEEAGISPNNRRHILYDNAFKLFGLDSIEVGAE